MCIMYEEMNEFDWNYKNDLAQWSCPGLKATRVERSLPKRLDPRPLKPPKLGPRAPNPGYRGSGGPSNC